MEERDIAHNSSGKCAQVERKYVRKIAFDLHFLLPEHIGGSQAGDEAILKCHSRHSIKEIKVRYLLFSFFLKCICLCIVKKSEEIKLI
jgi:hypothetical protein